MPLLGNCEYVEPVAKPPKSYPAYDDDGQKPSSALLQSQHSGVARTAIMSHFSLQGNDSAPSEHDRGSTDRRHRHLEASDAKLPNASVGTTRRPRAEERALSDTPVTTAPNTPVIPPKRRDSGSPQPSRPRAATTLDIPGLTKSKVSPDGKISQRDIGSKLVIVMVGLPARGKSYITKKLARYLNWLQHDTRIFNVGEKRRDVTTCHGFNSAQRPSDIPCKRFAHDLSQVAASLTGILGDARAKTPPTSPQTQILINGDLPPQTPPFDALPPSAMVTLSDEEYMTPPQEYSSINNVHEPTTEMTQVEEHMEQSAGFFDPSNKKASMLREQLAMETLDDLLDFIVDKGGSVGIFDATNSTLERRKAITERIRSRAGPDLGVLFLESLCIDESLLEANMRLKLSGPDYKDQDPVAALEDFRKRVTMYQKKYVSLGDYEEKNDMQYIQMIDVGRKIISHKIRGFLSAQTNYYLLNFNLAPRQIWITRHGESVDNINGKIGGDSSLTDNGRTYAKALTAFIQDQRQSWEVRQQDRVLSTHFPPQPGDTTPPNPEYSTNETGSKSFCVWTSMLQRSIQTAQYFDEEDFEIKQMKMLDELNAGIMEGLTYEEIKEKFSEEYDLRKQDKLHYRYPGAGGEGYLDIINRLRTVIHEVERMTDHVLLVGHRSVARVLLAYFKGLNREDVADLEVPLGVLYMLEPKPYGVDFKAYRYNTETHWFEYEPEYELRRAKTQTAY